MLFSSLVFVLPSVILHSTRVYGAPAGTIHADQLQASEENHEEGHQNPGVLEIMSQGNDPIDSAPEVIYKGPDENDDDLGDDGSGSDDDNPDNWLVLSGAESDDDDDYNNDDEEGFSADEVCDKLSPESALEHFAIVCPRQSGKFNSKQLVDQRAKDKIQAEKDKKQRVKDEDQRKKDRQRHRDDQESERAQLRLQHNTGFSGRF